MENLLIYCLLFHVVGSSVLVDVDVLNILAETDEKFVGVTLDSGLIRSNWSYFSFSSTKLQTLAKALMPSFLRLGGTDADLCTFDPTSASDRKLNSQNLYWRSKEKQEKVPGNVNKGYTNFTLSAAVWDNVHQFARSVGWDLIFDLNALFRTDNIWNSTNAEELLKYTHQKGYKMAGWELSNEPNIYSHLEIGAHVAGEQLATDFKTLAELLQRYSDVKGSILIGPSTTQLDQNATNNYFSEFLGKGGGQVVTNPNFHHYYLDGHTAKISQFIDPIILNELQISIDAGNKMAKQSAGGKKVWIGETATAWGGGAENLSDAFVAAFMWLDKLGLAAKNNISAVLRQSFYGGNYGLVDYYSLDPNPDYWLTLLYKRLVGGKVFQVSTSDKSDKLRFYAHCSASYYYEQGSITVYGMNLYSDFKSLSLAQYENRELHVYIMTAPNGDIRSRSASLNGEILEMVSDKELPELHNPLIMQGTIVMPPYSYVFVVIPEAAAAVCIT